MDQPQTRPSLIVRLKDQRDDVAWAEFVSAYEPFLRRLIERRGVPTRDVADVTQQLLLAIARSVEGWRDDGRPASFRRWLSRVARNLVLKFMVHQRRQIGGQGGTDFIKQLDNVPEISGEPWAREYEHELVVWAAEQVRSEFQETSWKAFWGTLVDGRPVAEVAHQLGVTPGSIYMSRSRIMARIRAKIREVVEE